MNLSAEHLNTWLRRQEPKKTQRQFSVDLGISYQYLSRMMCGKAKPSRILALAIQDETGGFVKIADWDVVVYRVAAE